VELSTLNAEGVPVAVAAQTNRRQDDYLSMKIPTKFREAPTLVIAKAELG